MNWKGTIVLSFILILLGLYLYFFELRGKEEKVAKLETTQRLFSFSEDEITEITVIGSHGRIVLQAVSGLPEASFLIRSPIDTEADTGVASAFSFQLTRLKWTEKIEENPTDLIPYGLNPPVYSVEIALKGSKGGAPLLIGGENITGQGLYAQVGNTVYLIDKGMKAYLEKELNDWRRKELFRFVSSDVKAIDIRPCCGDSSTAATSSQAVAFEVEKEGEGWRISSFPPEEKGIMEKANPSKVLRFLGTVSSLRGEGFIDENKAEKIAQWGAPLFSLKVSSRATEEAVFYNDLNEPDFVYAVTTSNAPLYKISRNRFKEIAEPVSYFQEEKKEEK